jgi:hypothetical protein
VDPFQGDLGNLDGCHAPSLGVSTIFCFLEVLEAVSSGGPFLVGGDPVSSVIY